MRKQKSNIKNSENIKIYMVFFILLPTILIFIYCLPPVFKQYLILNPSNPTLISIFFSNYTHSDFHHLMGNLIIYFLIIFLLFKIEVNKKIFYLFSFLNFALFPFLSSFLIILFLPNLLSVQGFSAIVSGFIGYFLYSIYVYVKNFYYKKTNYLFLFLLLIINFMVWQIFNEPKSLFFFLLLIVTIILIYANKVPIKMILSKISLKYRSLSSQNFILRFYKIFIFLLTIIFMFSFCMLVPSKIIVNNKVTDIFSHYVGYCFGVCSNFHQKLIK